MREVLYDSLRILSRNSLLDKEFLARCLLLAAILDQHADSVSARKTVTKIYEVYRESFFITPWNHINDFNKLMNLIMQPY